MEKLINKSVLDYINDVDSSLPAPGGGSVTAVVASLACALAGMVAHLTVNKKKFKELETEKQIAFNNAVENIKQIKSQLIEIVDKDADMFQLIMDAYKLPKDTDEQKEIRKNAISEAAKKALEPPLQTLKSCYKLLEHFEIIHKYGNEGVISDIVCAYTILYAAAKCSIVNININLSSINDENFLHNTKNTCLYYLRGMKKTYKEVNFALLDI